MHIEVTNDEYDRIMRERQPEHVKATGYCEDYPCCGHGPDDPCGYQPYDNPQRVHEYVSTHLYCDHEAGVYECAGMYDGEEIDPEDCDHGDWSWRTVRGRRVIECDICEIELKEVAHAVDHWIPCKSVPEMGLLRMPLLTIEMVAA